MLSLSQPILDDPILVAMLPYRSISLGAASLLLLYVVGKYWPGKTRHRYPPGPRALPFIGSAYTARIIMQG